MADVSTYKEFKVVFSTEVSKLLAGLKQVDKVLAENFKKMKNASGDTSKDITTTLGKIGGAYYAFSKTVQYYTQFTEAAFRIDQLSKSININSGELQQWQHAAELAGGSAEGIAGTMQRLRTQAYAFKYYGALPDMRALGVLGVRMSELMNRDGTPKSIEQTFKAYSRGLRTRKTQDEAMFWGQRLGLDEGTTRLLYQGRLQEALDAVKKYNVSQNDLEEGAKGRTALKEFGIAIKSSGIKAFADAANLLAGPMKSLAGAIGKGSNNTALNIAGWGTAIVGVGALLGKLTGTIGRIFGGGAGKALTEEGLARAIAEGLKQSGTQMGANAATQAATDAEALAAMQAANGVGAATAEATAATTTLPATASLLSILGPIVGGGGLMAGMFRLMSFFETPESRQKTEELNTKSASFYNSDEWNAFTDPNGLWAARDKKKTATKDALQAMQGQQDQLLKYANPTTTNISKEVNINEGAFQITVQAQDSEELANGLKDDILDIIDQKQAENRQIEYWLHNH